MNSRDRSVPSSKRTLEGAGSCDVEMIDLSSDEEDGIKVKGSPYVNRCRELKMEGKGDSPKDQGPKEVSPFSRKFPASHAKCLTPTPASGGRSDSPRFYSKMNANPTISKGGGGTPSRIPQLQRIQAAAKLKAQKAGEIRRTKALKLRNQSWADRNYPAGMGDLFVHKKKVDEVRSWLSQTMAQKAKGQICVLTGPSGTGKTATAFLAAKELGLEVKEWINSTPLTEYRAEKSEEDREFIGKGQFDLFSEFLFRASEYNTLKLKGKGMEKKSRKLIIVEDFPNLFYRDVQLFHNSILRPFASRGVFPVIFIISDSQAKESCVRTLFPQNILQELHIAQISFNGVASTYMMKFLMSVCSKEGVVADKEYLESVVKTTGGDIRCAINSLEFQLGLGNSPSTFKTPFPKSGTSRRPKKLTSADIQKDETLFLFRALGKILYAKRDSSKSIEETRGVPYDDLQLLRPHPLQDKPENVVEKIAFPADIFLSFLQENYVPFFGILDDIVLSSGFMADSEFLLSRWPFDDSGTMSRDYKDRGCREEIALLIVCRGLMFSNMHKPKGQFRAMKGPSLADTRSRITKNIESSKELFESEGPLQSCFYTENLPFYSKLARFPRHCWSSAQKSFITEIGTVSKYFRSGYKSSLQENEVVDDLGDSEETVVPCVAKTNSTTEDVQRFVDVEGEDDYVIESCTSSEED